MLRMRLITNQFKLTGLQQSYNVHELPTTPPFRPNATLPASIRNYTLFICTKASSATSNSALITKESQTHSPCQHSMHEARDLQVNMHSIHFPSHNIRYHPQVQPVHKEILTTSCVHPYVASRRPAYPIIRTYCSITSQSWLLEPATGSRHSPHYEDVWLCLHVSVSSRSHEQEVGRQGVPFPVYTNTRGMYYCFNLC